MAENIKKIKDLGYDGVELAVRDPESLNLNELQSLLSTNHLPVPALGTGQAKEPFLQDRVALIPQSDSQADVLKSVAEAAYPVFAPAIGSTASLGVGEIAPCLAGGAVVLTHCTPGALAEIGSPFPPTRLALSVCLQASVFGSSSHGRIPPWPVILQGSSLQVRSISPTLQA